MTAVAEPRRRQGRPRTPIEHGTEAGYQKHLRYGPKIPKGDPCGCRRANREAVGRRIARLPPRPARKRVRPNPARRYTQQERAVIDLVLRNATDKADARQLLEALGLA